MGILSSLQQSIQERLFSHKGRIKQLFFWFGLSIIGLGLYSGLRSSKALGWVELPDPQEPLRFYSNQVGDDLDRVLKAALSGARSTIYMEIFSLSEPSVVQLLNQKAKEGVRIYLIVDERYLPTLRPHLLNVVELRAGQSSTGLMHRKVLVIDGKQCWFGSANFTWESLKSDSNLLAGAWSQQLAQLLTDESYPSHGQVKVGSQTLELWNIPEAPASAGKIIEAIERAKSQLRIAMFTWTRQDIAEAVVRAQQRGVSVEVLFDKRSAEGASEPILHYLKAQKIPLRISDQMQTMHHKLLWIDSTHLFFGSVNWTHGGFRRNRDLLVYIPALSSPQSDFFKALWQVLWVGAAAP